MNEKILKEITDTENPELKAYEDMIDDMIDDDLFKGDKVELAFGEYTKVVLERSHEISINYNDILTGNYENLRFLPDNAYISINLSPSDDINISE